MIWDIIECKLIILDIDYPTNLANSIKAIYFFNLLPGVYLYIKN